MNDYQRLAVALCCAALFLTATFGFTALRARITRRRQRAAARAEGLPWRLYGLRFVTAPSGAKPGTDAWAQAQPAGTKLRRRRWDVIGSANFRCNYHWYLALDGSGLHSACSDGRAEYLGSGFLPFGLDADDWYVFQPAEQPATRQRANARKGAA